MATWLWLMTILLYFIRFDILGIRDISCWFFHAAPTGRLKSHSAVDSCILSPKTLFRGKITIVVTPPPTTTNTFRKRAVINSDVPFHNIIRKYINSYWPHDIIIMWVWVGTIGEVAGSSTLQSPAISKETIDFSETIWLYSSFAGYKNKDSKRQ